MRFQETKIPGVVLVDLDRREDHRLAGQSVCRERQVFGDIAMPAALQMLLERSYALYTRVERLDEMVARATH